MHHRLPHFVLNYFCLCILVIRNLFLGINETISVRENMNTTLTKKFIDEMKTYQQAQQKYKTDIKKKVTRQVKVVSPDATEEDIDAVLKSEGGRDALYKKKVLAGSINDEIKYVTTLFHAVVLCCCSSLSLWTAPNACALCSIYRC